MSRGGDLQEIKALLQGMIEPLCRDLVPKGKRSGAYWMACNPTRDDTRPSFWIKIHGAPGAWRDEATEDKGDVLQLIAYIHGWDRKDYRQTLAWARNWLGIENMPAGQRAERIAQAKKASEEETQRAARRLLDDRRRAKGTWLHCQKTLIGTVAETYLAGRGIRIADLERQPGALRFSPNQKHGESGESWPAIVTAMVGSDNSIVAIHRTFLAPDGSGKAPVEPQRKIWPRYKDTGACIHLWRGETGLSHVDAAKQGLWDTLVITEGIEDGLAIAQACPEHRVWVAGTLGNIAGIRLPECCGEVIVCADNDWGRPEAQRALEQGLTALTRQGRRTVKVAHSPLGKDVNDGLKAEQAWVES